MSALAGRVGYPRRTPYAASKWGLVGYAKSLARELGPAGIRVNAVLPGGVAGPRLEAVFDGRAAASGLSRDAVVSNALRNQSVKEFTTAEDVAELVLYLCSESARRISGQAIAIDGDSQAAE